ncbi:hypothetical protein, partial [Psittacicella gerlachiana]
MSFKYYFAQNCAPLLHSWLEADAQELELFKQQGQELASLIAPLDPEQLANLALEQLCQQTLAQTQSLALPLDAKAKEAVKFLTQLELLKLPQAGILYHAQQLTQLAYATWQQIRQQPTFAKLLAQYGQLVAKPLTNSFTFYQLLERKKEIFVAWQQ